MTGARKKLNPIHILPTVPYDGTHPQRAFVRRRKFNLDLAVDREFDSGEDGRAMLADIANPGVYELNPIRVLYHQTDRNIQT